MEVYNLVFPHEREGQKGILADAKDAIGAFWSEMMIMVTVE